MAFDPDTDTSVFILLLLLHSFLLASSDQPNLRHPALSGSWRQLTFSTYGEPACGCHRHGYITEPGSERRPHSFPGVRDHMWVEVGGEFNRNQSEWQAKSCGVK